MNVRKNRLDRMSQAKIRGSHSYKTEMENLQILLAWEAAELSEGQAAKALDMDRVSLRMLKEASIKSGILLCDDLKRRAKP
mgnify:CR=1 FL=1